MKFMKALLCVNIDWIHKNITWTIDAAISNDPLSLSPYVVNTNVYEISRVRTSDISPILILFLCFNSKIFSNNK
jgi:hypothetical protein